MEKEVDTNHHDNNLSHSNSVTDGNTNIDVVFEPSVELDNADNAEESELSVLLSNEMSATSSADKMTFNEIRPRSFSDASVGKERPGILKKLQGRLVGKEKRTCMKVFVKRESKVATPQELVQFEASHDAEFGFHQCREGDRVAPRFPKSASFDDMLKYPHADHAPPPKPRLPQDYRKSLLNQLEHFKEHYCQTEDDVDMEEEGGFNSASKILTRVDTDKRLQENLQARKDSNSEQSKTSRRKVSSPKVVERTTSLVYKHFDTKFQSELLRKELEKLRTHKHVRKNSETMKQKFETILRQKTMSDAHVRFADEAVESDGTRFSEGELGGVWSPKLTLRQALSLDLHAADINLSKPSGLSSKTAKPHSHEHDTRNSYDEVGISGTDSDDLGRDRSRNTSRGQETFRSKSASATEGYKHSDTSVPVNSLGSKNDSNLSKSATNLRRNMETIRKFNAESLKQKRELVKRKYKQNPRVSVTTDDTNVDLERDFADAQDKLVPKSSKFVSDNRSDEEKYAALSRNKTLYTKSGPVRQDGPSGVQHDQTKVNTQRKAQSDKDRNVSESEDVRSRQTSVSRRQTCDTFKSGAKNQGADVMVQDVQYCVDLSSGRPDTKGASSSTHVPNVFLTVTSQPVKPNNVNMNTNSSQNMAGIPDAPVLVHSNSEDRVGLTGEMGQIVRGGKIVLRTGRMGQDVVFGLVCVQDRKAGESGSGDKQHQTVQNRKAVESSSGVERDQTLSQSNANGYHDGPGLVTIRMIPDAQGRFGFNVKGGADQGMPIIVSRVAPNTPADNADPRLNEGDQVLYINGRDVSQHTHEQVVKFIRHSRDSHAKDLHLIVRPNAYITDNEADLVYVPETCMITAPSSGGNALESSLHLLEETLESGAALAQFEQLYRKKPGMTTKVARLEINVPKNRYRDISPYDDTRVMIKNGPNGDYINANYVNMEIPVSGILNRYIAAQGPLPTTCVDFWQMIWEQQSSLVVMLTTEVEKGRIKCHQYWPNLKETSVFGDLQITCIKEEKSTSFAFREFNLTHVESEDERHISHMQYIAWPDHGVPDDPADFLEFVVKVRQKRVGVEPSIVHCSAGIGRTGVLITMETAMCLIEANQAVHPLSIVRQMRDQRAMLIQTANQYKFVCEAIIRCYNESIVKPLPEYQQR